MKFSEQWLRTWVNPAASSAELMERLTMAGLEIEGYEAVAPAFNKVLVGEVVSLEKHPDADKLRVCQVNVGAENLLNIVCGAANVAANQRVAVAVDGAVLPNDFKIKKSKLRGVVSEGMICSIKELGLAETSDGIWVLPADAPIGQDLRSYLQLDDLTIELKITPNRADCLGISGIAREVGVLTQTQVNPVACNAVPATHSEKFPVQLVASQECPRYLGRIIKGVNNRLSTPLWMQERLRRSGLRCLSPIVDITNYVLLELGQPMHAFDLAKLKGGIVVRLAQANESLTLLDGQKVKLDDKTLVIADQQNALAMAGVMGGLDSSVTLDTSDIFLESAFFSPVQLAGCARRYGLNTDSAYRFERGVDFQLQRAAMERATALVLEIVGGQAGEIVEVVETAHLPTIEPVTLRAARIERMLGLNLDAALVSDILQRLGMNFTTNITAEGVIWQVQPPSFRFDIRIEADLIEELARIYGYNTLPQRAPLINLQMQAYQRRPLSQLQTILTQRGYQEVITYSFVEAQLLEKLNPNVPSLTLANPIASDMSVMRTTLWAGLLNTVSYNQKRQQTRVRLFETGLRFVKTETGIEQTPMLAGVVSGSAFAEQWGEKARAVDFFDVKADVEALLNLLGLETCHFVAETHPALHPGQSAAIYWGQQKIGMMGALHPQWLQNLDLTAPIYLFELEVEPLLVLTTSKAKEISKYPSIRRDLAIVLNQEISSAQLIEVTKKNVDSDLLQELFLFDVYQGKGVETTKKSIAMGLIFQAKSRNLTESEIETQIERLLSSLAKELNAELRK